MNKSPVGFCGQEVCTHERATSFREVYFRYQRSLLLHSPTACISLSCYASSSMISIYRTMSSLSLLLIIDLLLALALVTNTSSFLKAPHLCFAPPNPHPHPLRSRPCPRARRSQPRRTCPLAPYVGVELGHRILDMAEVHGCASRGIGGCCGQGCIRAGYGCRGGRQAYRVEWCVKGPMYRKGGRGWWDRRRFLTSRW